MIKNIGKNVTEIHLQGLILLLSYETPVAWYDNDCNIMYVTTTKWSKTTSKHIGKFVDRHVKDNESYLLDNIEQNELNMLYNNILSGCTPAEFHVINNIKDRFDDLII